MKQLLYWKDFYDNDLVISQNEVEKAKVYEKYNLPNWRSEMIRRQMGVEESQRNVNFINEAIRIAKKRGI